MKFDLSKLGVKKNIPKVDFLAYTGVFEAPEKFGKTTFASLYPNAILLGSEKGYMAHVMDVKDIHSWDDLVEFIDLLEDNREDIGDDIQSIIIDTVDELYPLAGDYVVRKQGLKDGTMYSSIKDIPYGQGWGLHDAEFKRQVKRILNMGFCILYLTHSKVKTIKPKKGESYDVYTSTMPDRCANIVYPACDYIIHGERRNVEVAKGKTVSKRALTVRGGDEAIAGSRVSFDEDILFDNEEEAMEKFRAKFREGIERNLRKAGIQTDLEILEKQQKEERTEEVKKYIAEQRSVKTPDELIEEIGKLVKSIPKPKIGQAGEELKKILGSTNYQKFTSEDDVENLQKVVEALQALIG